MKNFTLLLLFALFSINSFAQKVDYDKKTDAVTDEKGNLLFKMVAKRNAASTLMEYSVQDKDGKELFFISSTNSFSVVFNVNVRLQKASF